MIISVKGIVSGDGECWCLKVSREEYIKLIGLNKWEKEVEMYKRWMEDVDENDPFDQKIIKDYQNRINNPSYLFLVYPDMLVQAAGFEYKEENKNKEIMIRMEVLNPTDLDV